jgi:hypothetical protein
LIKLSETDKISSVEKISKEDDDEIIEGNIENNPEGLNKGDSEVNPTES